MSEHRLHLNITERCNLHCTHCYWEKPGVHPDPSLKDIEKILDKFKLFGLSFGERTNHTLTLGGGEPLLREDLEDIIFLSRNKGFISRIVTNGVLIDVERAKSLKKAGLWFVQVSLDGASEEIHDKIRGKGNWLRTMSGIEALKKAGIFIVLCMVLLPGINTDEAPLLLNIAQELKLGGVKFSRPVFKGQAKVNNLQSQADFGKIFLEILNHARARHYRRLLLLLDPFAHLLPHYVPLLLRGRWGLMTDMCNCEQTELVELNGSTGDIFYCRMREKLGNIWEDNLFCLWQNHPFLREIRFRQSIALCRECPVWSKCRGGCPAVVHARTGLIGEADTDCPLDIFSAEHYSGSDSMWKHLRNLFEF